MSGSNRKSSSQSAQADSDLKETTPASKSSVGRSAQLAGRIPKARPSTKVVSPSTSDASPPPSVTRTPKVSFNTNTEKSSIRSSTSYRKRDENAVTIKIGRSPSSSPASSPARSGRKSSPLLRSERRTPAKVESERKSSPPLRSERRTPAQGESERKSSPPLRSERKTPVQAQAESGRRTSPPLRSERRTPAQSERSSPLLRSERRASPPLRSEKRTPVQSEKRASPPPRSGREISPSPQERTSRGQREPSPRQRVLSPSSSEGNYSRENSPVSRSPPRQELYRTKSPVYQKSPLPVRRSGTVVVPERREQESDVSDIEERTTVTSSGSNRASSSTTSRATTRVIEERKEESLATIPIGNGDSLKVSLTGLESDLAAKIAAIKPLPTTRPPYKPKNNGGVVYVLVRILCSKKLDVIVDWFNNMTTKYGGPIDIGDLYAVGSIRVNHDKDKTDKAKDVPRCEDNYNRYSETDISHAAIHPEIWAVLNNATNPTPYVIRSEYPTTELFMTKYELKRDTNDFPKENSSKHLHCCFKDTSLISLEESMRQIHLKMENMIECGYVAPGSYTIYNPLNSRESYSEARTKCIIIFDESVGINNRAAIKMILDQTKFQGKYDPNTISERDPIGKRIPYMCIISWMKNNSISEITSRYKFTLGRGKSRPRDKYSTLTSEAVKENLTKTQPRGGGGGRR
jgi:hypothetical protein